MKYTKLPPNTGYLGHFKNHLKEGHNTSWRSKIDSSLPEKKPETIKKAPLPGGIRG
jgi:hypothetical protein